MATTRRGEKRRIDDNERISKCNTDEAEKQRIDDNERISKHNTSEAEKRMKTDDSVEGIYDMICIIFFYKKLYTV
jgi:hypothetical protein